MSLENKKILLIGSGGREHALAWKLAESQEIEKIYVAPGNAGTAHLNKCKNVNITSIEALTTFAKENKIDLTVVGPEAMLVDGIADEFHKAELRIFAPNKKGAQLEGSKSFAKEFMNRYGVKTARHRNFKGHSFAAEYLNMVNYPVVIKASGLAAGKGVIICQDQAEAEQALQDLMLNEKFGNAGAEVVIEEFLTGFEVSILSICDGETILPFISAKDHKKIGEGETGLNTGGMGVIAPNPLFNQSHHNQFITDILQPTLEGIKQEGIDFTGVIFFGLMVNENGVYLLEYNTRFGDPETQTVLPLLENDLFGLLEACIDKTLAKQELKWKEANSCCVVAASGGYPEAYEKGKEIKIGQIEDAQIFMAGVSERDNTLVTSGGRVLNVVSQGSTLEEARNNAYKAMKNISFEKIVFRTDIGDIQ